MVDWLVYADGVYLGTVKARNEREAGAIVVSRYADNFPDDTEFKITRA